MPKKKECDYGESVDPNRCTYVHWNVQIPPQTPSEMYYLPAGPLLNLPSELLNFNKIMKQK